MNILVVSPAFIPMAGVGMMRMGSLVRHLAPNHDIVVVQNAISSYDSVTTDKPIDGVTVQEVDVRGDFMYDSVVYREAIDKVMKRSRFDAAVISVGPFFTLPLVKHIKKTSGVPVILDYRDLWSISYRNNDARSTMREWAKIHLVESAALKAAAAVTITDDESLEALMSQYPFLENKPCRAILNGFDDNALKKMENLDRAVLREQEPMTIGIFGKFESYISLKNLPWFIKLLREYSARRDGGIRVFHYGAPEPVLAMGMRDAGIDYEDRGYAQYEVGIENLVKSANVLLAANDVMMGYGTKIFDYIFINKPVLMYAPQGSTLDRFVGGFPNGYSFHDEESLRAALEDLFRDKPEHLAGSMDPYKYGRSHQNQLFEKFIEEVANGTGKENK